MTWHKAPLIPFLGLVHLRMALLLSILGRRGRVQDGRVHNRARGDAHSPGLQVQIVAAPNFSVMSPLMKYGRVYCRLLAILE
jgi:hypothetical protein